LRPFNLHAALGQALLFETGMPQVPTLIPAALQRLGDGGTAKGGAGGPGGNGASNSVEAFPFRLDLYEFHFVMTGAQVLIITNRRLILLDAQGGCSDKVPVIEEYLGK
jgi:hypothetical protein